MSCQLVSRRAERALTPPYDEKGAMQHYEGTDAQFRHFLDMALGSASELEYQLLAAIDLGYGDAAVAAKMRSRATEVKRMLAKFISRLSEA